MTESCEFAIAHATGTFLGGEHFFAVNSCFIAGTERSSYVLAHGTGASVSLPLSMMGLGLLTFRPGSCEDDDAPAHLLRWPQVKTCHTNTHVI